MKRPVHKLAKRGQTMLFLVMVVVILAFVALWNFDLHKLIYVKTISGNASDAAAIAAARWQGITLNLLGDLNVAQAVAIDNALAHPVGEPPTPDFTEAVAIAGLASRVQYVGPMMGYSAAQQAAKNNRAYVNPVFTQRVFDHAKSVRAQALANGDTNLTDYADMLDTVAAGGIAAFASDAAYHILWDQNFYSSIQGTNYCWLQPWLDYTWQSWPPIRFLEPLTVNVSVQSSLAALTGWMGDAGTPAKALQNLSTFAGHALSPELLGNTPPMVPATWFCYDNSWSSWTTALQVQGRPAFPWLSTIKPEYDVAGAAADMRVSTETPAAYFNNSSNHVTSVAAAKPFGYLVGPVPASQYGIVLPAFHDARLVPVGSSCVAVPADDNTDDSSTVPDDHKYQHVPLYLKYGPSGIQAFAAQCQDCRDLLLWDTSSFRATGKQWLTTHDCPHSTGGVGGGSGGGTAYGH